MDKNIKNIIKWGLLVIIPLIVGVLSLVIYDLYIELLKKIDENTLYVKDQTVQQLVKNENKQGPKNIQRLSYLKYIHYNDKQKTDENSALYLIEIVRIGHCKYIIVSKKDQSLFVLHANDCDWEGHKKQKE